MKNHTEIKGWFGFTQTYDFLVSQIPDDGTFVECGAWLGKSSSYLCDIAGDRVKVFIVDSWLGSKNELNTNHKSVITTDIYSLFLENMGDRKFNPIKKLSDEAVLDFENNSCDVVFLDMEHTFEAVSKDIELWFDKVKPGGYISGHDYNKWWPGVVKAVDEKFGRDNLTFIDRSCWMFKKS